MASEKANTYVLSSRLLSNFDYLFDAITSIDKVCAPFTDHAAVTLFLNNSEEQIWGRGYWKFNSCFLKEKEYAELVSKVYEDCLSEFEEVQDKRLLWDLVKYKLRQASIDFGKTKAQSRRHKEEYISEQLKDLEQKLAENKDLERNAEKSATWAIDKSVMQ